MLPRCCRPRARTHGSSGLLPSDSRINGPWRFNALPVGCCNAESQKLAGFPRLECDPPMVTYTILFQGLGMAGPIAGRPPRIPAAIRGPEIPACVRDSTVSLCRVPLPANFHCGSGATLFGRFFPGLFSQYRGPPRTRGTASHSLPVALRVEPDGEHGSRRGQPMPERC